jgi:hypothetical protein
MEIKYQEIIGATKKIVIEVPEGYEIKGPPTLEYFLPRGDEFLSVPVAPVKKGK